MKRRSLVWLALLGFAALVSLGGAASAAQTGEKRRLSVEAPSAQPGGPGAASVAKGRRFAVIVGVVQEKHPLNFTRNDARLMRAVIGGPDSDALLLLSEYGSPAGRPTRDNILRAVEEVAKKAGSEDSLWFYFSGHGTLGPDGRSYILPEDWSGGVSGLIAISDVRRAFLKSRAHTKVVISDSCYSGSSKAAGIGTLEQTVGGINGVVTMAGCDADQTSLEIPSLRHGLFTFFLARGLAGEASTSGKPATLKMLHHYLAERIHQFLQTAPPDLRDAPQTPVFLVTQDQEDTLVQISNPALLASNPVPVSAGEVRPMRPIPPGIVVALRAAEDTDPKLLRLVESQLRNRLIANRYPVVARDLAEQFEGILNDRNTAAAAEQAGKMNAHFLLRGEVQASVRSNTGFADGTYTASVSVQIEVIDAQGHVLVSESSGNEWGVNVRKAAGSPEYALEQASDEACKIAIQRALRLMDTGVKPKLTATK